MAGMGRIARITVTLGAALALLAPLDGGATAQSFRGGNGGGRTGLGGHGGGFGFGLGFGPPAMLLPLGPPPDDDYDEPPPRRRPHPVRVGPPDDGESEDGAPLRHRVSRPKPVVREVARPTPQPTILHTKPVLMRPTPAAPKAPAVARLPPNPSLTRPKPPPPVTAGAPRARLPLAETRYRPDEILVEVALTTPPTRIADVLARHRLTEAEAVYVDLIGVSLRRWRIGDARSASSVVAELGGETALARIQPNYLFAPADEVAPSLSGAQYALVKMKVDPSLEDSAAAPIRVAVIDTAIDESHPDLAGAVEARFDAIGGAVVSQDHGTAMAGGIAANGRLRGVARHVKILSARAFDIDGAGGALGTTLSIVKSLDWAARQKAQVVNMSFAGPDDPTLRDALAAAHARGIALVGAVGNAGPAAPPQYPGADAHVIAATATDADDKLYPSANVGAYVAISAPGVDVLLPAPGGGYAMETGTSVSSALIAGVVALMFERKPDLKPDEVRQRLTATATQLGGAQEFGAGLVDAARAVRP